MPELSTFLIVCPLVFLAGLIDAVAGGGGLISLPAYLVAGLPPKAALATNKLSSFMGTLISTGRFLRHGYVDRSVILPSVLVTLGGAGLGASMALLMPDRVIRLLIIPLLPFAAFYVLRRKDLGGGEEREALPRKKYFAAVLAVSLLVGSYDGFFGPGTGTFLLLLYSGACRMDIRTAAGNTKVVNLTSNLAALSVFLLHGEVMMTLGLTAGVFGIIGNYIGSGIVMKKGAGAIRPVMLFVLALLFVKLLLD